MDLRFGDIATARVPDPRSGDKQQPLSHQLLRIRAVVDGRTELKGLASRFVLRSVTHLRGQISHVVDDVIGGITKVTDSEWEETLFTITYLLIWRSCCVPLMRSLAPSQC